MNYDLAIGALAGSAITLFLIAILISSVKNRSLELAYGLLWMTPVDRTTHPGWLVSEARRQLAESLDKDQRRRGITLAMLHNQNHSQAPKEKL